MNNITNEVTDKDFETQQTQQQTQQPTQQTQQPHIKDIKIDNENIALNVMVGMLNIAQKRGAFSLEESSKTWECVQMFMKNEELQASQ